MSSEAGCSAACLCVHHQPRRPCASSSGTACLCVSASEGQVLVSWGTTGASSPAHTDAFREGSLEEVTATLMRR